MQYSLLCHFLLPGAPIFTCVNTDRPKKAPQQSEIALPQRLHVNVKLVKNTYGSKNTNTQVYVCMSKKAEALGQRLDSGSMSYGFAPCRKSLQPTNSAPYKSIRPTLTVSASFTRSINSSSSLPIRSLSCFLSIVRICSSKMTESLERP